MKSTLRYIIQWGLIALIGVFLLRYLQTQWTQLDLQNVTPNWPVLALSLVVYTIGMGLLPYGSSRIQHWFGYNLSAYTIWRSFFVSQFAKYMPGGIWSIPGRAIMYHRNNIPAMKSGVLVALEILGLVIGACVTGLLSIPVFLPLLLDIIVPATLILVSGTLVLAAILWFTRARWLPLARQVPPFSFAVICLAYAINWVIIGLAFALIAPGLNLPLDIPTTLQIIGIHSVAWFLGFIVFFAPGGIGVRDAVLALGLTAFFPMPLPVIISLLARIAWTLSEIGGFFIIVPLLGYRGGKTQHEADHSNSLP